PAQMKGGQKRRNFRFDQNRKHHSSKTSAVRTWMMRKGTVSTAPNANGPKTMTASTQPRIARSQNWSHDPRSESVIDQFGRNWRGSVIFPVKALAATVAGEARNTWLSLWPIRPGKLRLVALMHFIGEFMRLKVSTGPPRQAAQPAFSVICTPASIRICQTVFSPQRAVCKSLTISGVA